MSEVSIKVPRKIFQVLIHDNPYDVYDIEGKEHGGWNGEPKTWWVYYADRLPEGTIPPTNSDSWEPYNVGIKRVLWDIRFKERNTAKEKWNTTQFSHTLKCEMWCNGKLIYSFGTHNIHFAFGKAQYLMVVLLEHSYNFLESEKEKGRKIFFYNLPATVEPSSHYPGEIAIIPDYTNMSKEEWWDEYKKRSFRPDEDFKEWDRHEEGYHSDRINWGDALSDGHIWWFRKEEPRTHKDLLKDTN